MPTPSFAVTPGVWTFPARCKEPGGVGGLLWANSTTHSFAASSDGNGNIVAWVNTASLAFAGRADYGAFGEPVMRTGMANTLPFGFSSKYTDEETELLYYGYRSYDPCTGRWLSRDPIAENGGLNLYGMVGNDTINTFDYLGLWKIERSPDADYGRAIAEEGDSWLGLGEAISLDGSEYKKWSSYYINGGEIRAGERPHKGCSYRVPNLYYVMVGDLSEETFVPLLPVNKFPKIGKINNIPLLWARNRGLARKSERIIMEMSRATAPLRVKKILTANLADFKAALSDRNTYGIAWHSHGYEDGAIIGANGTDFKPSQLDAPNHRIATLRILACDSNVLASGWRRFISGKGQLRLIDGLLFNPYSHGTEYNETNETE